MGGLDVEASAADLAREILHGIDRNPYIPPEFRGVPLFPSPAQAELLLSDAPDLLYGGAAGGGKTIGFLFDALRFVHVPGYAALLARKSFPELNEPGGFIPTLREWLTGTDARWHETEHQARFPSGATITCRHVLNDQAAIRLGRGPTFQRVYIDEASMLTEFQIRQLGSRVRGPKTGPLSKVPTAMRLASNPGGVSHEYLLERYVRRDAPHPFIPSRVTDNPGLDVDAYIEQMRRTLDPVSLARLLEGDWTVVEGGFLFSKGAFQFLDAVPSGFTCRAWDCAATTGPNSKYTAGVRMTATDDGRFVIDDVVRFKARPGDRDARILETAHRDGYDVAVKIEKEPGSGGEKQAEDQIKMLAGFNISVDRTAGDKMARAAPLARQVEAGNVYIVRSGPWVGPFLDELHAAQPGATYLDQMDAAADCFNFLTRNGPTQAYTSTPARASRPTDQRLFSGRKRERLF